MYPDPHELVWLHQVSGTNLFAPGNRFIVQSDKMCLSFRAQREE